MRLDLLEKLWSRTKVEDGHWLWTLRLTSNGQGIVWYNGSDWVVSRLSLCIYLKLNYSENWQANHIDSLCRYRHCWNPLHLYVGTQKDNMQDRVERMDYKTHCVRGHVFDENNTLYSSGRRICRACNRIRNKKNVATQ